MGYCANCGHVIRSGAYCINCGVPANPQNADVQPSTPSGKTAGSIRKTPGFNLVIGVVCLVFGLYLCSITEMGSFVQGWGPVAERFGPHYEVQPYRLPGLLFIGVGIVMAIIGVNRLRRT